MTDMQDQELDRLVPLENWINENAHHRSIWQHGSPHLIEPAGMGKWLKRHEARLTDQGALIRLGKAWRIVEPAFKPAMFEILTEEREQAFRRQGKM